MMKTLRVMPPVALCLLSLGCLPTSSGGSDPDPVLILDDAGAADAGGGEDASTDPDADVTPDASSPGACPTPGSTDGCPAGQICDVSTGGNACYDLCSPGDACGAGEVCSPVAREGGGFSGSFDCYPATGGVAPGAACDPDGASCRLDQVCAPSAQGDELCSAWCLPGTGDGCEAGQGCVPSGIDGLGYCEREGACDGCFDGTACRPGTTNSACGSDGGACEVCAGEGVVCTEGVCAGPCDPGFNYCDEFCYPPDAIDACGPSCERCVDRPNAVTTCEGGECTYTCEADAVQCASGCCRPQPIATGWDHTCAVTQAGGLKCWGRNHQGQLGTGDTTSSGVPVDVPNLPAAALSVAAGDAHTCMLSTAGDVYCWGDNEFGQLGDGTGVDSLTPVAVSGLTADVVEISASKDHTCALSAQGGVFCWGYGTDGQLGDNTTAHRSTPVTPRGLGSDCVSVGVGWAHSCATCIDARGFSGTYCWGSDAYGQLGNNFDGDRTTPQRTANAGDHPKSLCGGGRHTCGVTRGGGIDCVGSDADGQLGYPGASTDTWKDVTGYPAGGVQVACGSFWTMALDDAGGVKFWGNELDGIDKIREPRDVPGLSFNVSAIDAGWNHACVVRTNGEVLCWGINTYGQVGVGSSESTIAEPTLVNL